MIFTKHNQHWITGGPWYNTYISKELHGTVFEKYIGNARTDRYNPIYSIDTYEKQQPSSVDDGRRGGVKIIPSNLTT